MMLGVHDVIMTNFHHRSTLQMNHGLLSPGSSLSLSIRLAAGLSFGHVEQPDPIQSSG
jgi:hypothetical protein